MRPFTVGLTGGIGAGKSIIASFFAKFGVPVIDADLITRDIWENDPLFIQNMREHFGNDVVISSCGINRAKIRDIVFSDPAELNFIEEILLPRIRNELQRTILSFNSPYVIAVVPLLFEKGFDDLADRTLCVDLEQDLQIIRAAERDNTTTEKIRMIMSMQLSRCERRNKSDDIIYNCESLYEKGCAVKKFHEFYLQRAMKK